MRRKSKNLGFLVEVYEEYEYSLAPPNDDEKETGLRKKGNYFVIDKNEKDIEEIIRKHLPEGEYKINIRKAEQKVEGIYDLGRIEHHE